MKSEPATVASTPDNLPDLDNLPGTNNGSPTPRQSRLPRAAGLSNRVKLLAAGAVLLVLALGSFAVYQFVTNPRSSERPDLVRHKVTKGRLELTIVERGALESAKNSDIYCRVKAGNKGSTVASQIKTVIDDGSEVLRDRPLKDVKVIYYFDQPSGTWRSRTGEAGADGLTVVESQESGDKTYSDLLVDLDDSGLQEQLKTQKITVDKAESDKIQAEEAYKITVSQNASDIKTAETQVELKTIALMKYTGLNKEEALKAETLARLKEQLQNAQSNARRPATEIANEDLKNYKSGDYLAALKDNLGQIETAQSDLSQQEDREAWAYRMVKKGYQTASQAQAETSRKEALQLTLNKQTLGLDVLVKYTKIQTLTQTLTDLEEAQRALERVKSQAKSKEVKDKTDREAKKSVWEQELAHYKDILEEIKKCKIYAPQDGMVVYYIPEQARFGGGSQQSIVAQGEPVREGQKLMQIPDLRHMLVNTKVHEALVTKVHQGQEALVRVDSAAGQFLHGHVESVATVAAQQDWMAADVKVYTTKVAIDAKEIEKYQLELKPGMSAEVTIIIADALENILTVPVQAIVGGSEMGDERRIVVMTPKGPQERTVKVGASNDKVAEVKDGLAEGDEVVLNPKAVLGDRIKTHDPGMAKSSVGGGGGEGGPAKGGPNGNGRGGKPGAKPAAGPGGSPGGGPPGGGAPGGGGGGWQNMSPEDQKKAEQAMLDRFRQATPEKRKEMLQQIPEAFRDTVKGRLKGAGIDVPD
jgi:multidrug resistance efflux pump